MSSSSRWKWWTVTRSTERFRKREQRPGRAREIAAVLREIGDGLRIASASSELSFQNLAQQRDYRRKPPNRCAAVSRISDGGPLIAVMPFQSLSTDSENEYFSDGLAEEILEALSGLQGLTVESRASSFSFKRKLAEVSEIGGKPRVANLLQGSVRTPPGNR